MHHIIKKQVINLTLYNKKDAFKIQHLISEHYWREIIPVLQKVFDAVSTEEEVIQLDKLEIDLGVITIKDIKTSRWEQDVFKKVSEQINIVVNHTALDEKI